MTETAQATDEPDEEPKALQPYQYQTPGALEKFEQMRLLSKMAEVFHQAGVFKDVNSSAAAVVKIMAGRELGLGEFASMNAFDIIQGKVEMTANTQAMLVKQHSRYDYRVLELTDERCVLVFLQDGEQIGTSEFEISDAKRAGILTQTWTKYPRNMLFARAMTNGCAWFCPDLTTVRVYAPAEVGGPEPTPEKVALPIEAKSGLSDEEIKERFKDAERIPFNPDTGEIIESPPESPAVDDGMPWEAENDPENGPDDNADFGGLDQGAVEDEVAGQPDAAEETPSTAPEETPGTDTGTDSEGAASDGEVPPAEGGPEPVPVAQTVEGSLPVPTPSSEPAEPEVGEAKAPASGEGGNDVPWTAAQRAAIFGINRNLGWTKEQLLEFAKRDSLSTLTKREAGALIDALSAAEKEQGP